MWGRLATCAAVGYRRRSTAKAAGADCQSAAGYQPAPQNLVRQPTPAQFFMGFRGPKAHSNRPRKSMVCPTLFLLAAQILHGQSGDLAGRLAQARQLMASGRFEEAIPVYRQIVKA